MRQERRRQIWHQPRELPPLLEETVHIWSVRLDGALVQPYRLAEALSVDELERAAAFRFAHLRRRFVVTRAVVRQLLALYVGATPSSLRFCYSALGKPSLIETHTGAPLSFNVSHSDELALIAVTRGRAVGVDVEGMREIDEADGIAEHYFCAPERDELRSSQGRSTTALFLTYWTRKEAVLKATGDGLSMPLDRVDVSGVPGEQPQTVVVLDGSGAPRQLALVDLKPTERYVGALAVEGIGWQYSCWRWPHSGDIK